MNRSKGYVGIAGMVAAALAFVTLIMMLPVLIGYTFYPESLNWFSGWICAAGDSTVVSIRHHWGTDDGGMAMSFRTYCRDAAGGETEVARYRILGALVAMAAACAAVIVGAFIAWLVAKARAEHRSASRVDDRAPEPRWELR